MTNLLGKFNCLVFPIVIFTNTRWRSRGTGHPITYWRRLACLLPVRLFIFFLSAVWPSGDNPCLWKHLPIHLVICFISSVNVFSFLATGKSTWEVYWLITANLRFLLPKVSPMLKSPVCDDKWMCQCAVILEAGKLNIDWCVHFDGKADWLQKRVRWQARIIFHSLSCRLICANLAAPALEKNKHAKFGGSISFW